MSATIAAPNGLICGTNENAQNIHGTIATTKVLGAGRTDRMQRRE
jgi:hypothetical protein